MVLVERLHKVIAQVLHAKGLGDEAQILREVLLAERDTKELPEPGHNVVLEPIAIDDRNNVVPVRRERRVRYIGEVVPDRASFVREDQPRLIQAVAAKHASDGETDER